MLIPFDARFFRALAEATAEMLGPDDAVARMAVQAAKSGRPDDLRKARRGLDALPAEDRDRILQVVHARLAGDLSAVWDRLPGAPTDPRMT